MRSYPNTSGVSAIVGRKRCYVNRLRSVVAVVVGCFAAAPAAASAQVGPDCREPERQTGQVREASIPLALTPAVWSVVQRPSMPVLGSDNRLHLVYELQFANTQPVAINIDEVKIIEPANGREVAGINTAFDMQGDSIAGKLRPFVEKAPPDTFAYGSSLGPAEGGLMYFDVVFARPNDIPDAIANEVTQSLPGEPGQPPITAISGIAPVCSDGAIVVRPPLRGRLWVNGDGCCSIIGPHRFTLLPINGQIRPAQHFATDFVQPSGACVRG